MKCGCLSGSRPEKNRFYKSEKCALASISKLYIGAAAASGRREGLF
jgi:hypothetical protein